MDGKVLPVLLLMMLGQVATAASPTTRLALSWDYDQNYSPQRFLLTVTQTGAPQHQFQVAPSAPGACMQLPAATAETFCTIVACPVRGSVTAYWVQADVGGMLSDPSNIVTCWIPPTALNCDCQDPTKAVPPVSPPPPPVVITRPVMPVLTTTPPPRPQQTADGLNLLPIGTLPRIPQVPPIPASGGM